MYNDVIKICKCRKFKFKRGKYIGNHSTKSAFFQLKNSSFNTSTTNHYMFYFTSINKDNDKSANAIKVLKIDRLE